mmetsp:Transcript_95927/g.271535  ORF Transcript_95927/g.271535 Transcript_95927/m.271535 type:complete len:356 (+) Transcript_95927:33-1100(+)
MLASTERGRSMSIEPGKPAALHPLALTYAEEKNDLPVNNSDIRRAAQGCEGLPADSARHMQRSEGLPSAMYRMQKWHLVGDPPSAVVKKTLRPMGIGVFKWSYKYRTFCLRTFFGDLSRGLTYFSFRFKAFDSLDFGHSDRGLGGSGVATRAIAAAFSWSARSRASVRLDGIAVMSFSSPADSLRDRRTRATSQRCLAQAPKKPASPMDLRSMRTRSRLGTHAVSSIGLRGKRRGARGALPRRTGLPSPSVTLVPSPGTVPPPSSSLANSVTETVLRKTTRCRFLKGQNPRRQKGLGVSCGAGPWRFMMPVRGGGRRIGGASAAGASWRLRGCGLRRAVALCGRAAPHACGALGV